jgi:hypothetical protein
MAVPVFVVVVVVVKRSDMSFSTVTFLTRKVLIVFKSALRRSAINCELLRAFCTC